MQSCRASSLGARRLSTAHTDPGANPGARAGPSPRARRDGGASERTWLIGILKRKIVDRLRGRYRTGETMASPEDQEAAFFNDRGRWQSGPQRWVKDPAAAMHDNDFWRVLQECLSNLPGRLRDAFWLRELDQMDSDEVCEVLGISSPNLWQRLFRARLGMRQCLESNWFGRPPTERRVAP